MGLSLPEISFALCYICSIVETLTKRTNPPMPPNPPRISDAEWEVMNLLWQHPALTLAQIVQGLSARKEWSARTTRTLLGRLMTKRCVRRRKEGKRPVYAAAIARDACLRHASDSFLDRVFGGEPAAMLVHLVKETKLSAADIKELKRILEEKQS